MVQAALLHDLIRKSEKFDRRIQDLERRLKRAERVNNPIALIEPEGVEQITGGRTINCCFRNVVKTEASTTVFQNNGTLAKTPSTESQVLLKFAVPVRRIDALRFNYVTANDDLTLLASIADADTMTVFNLDLIVDFLTADYDPTTVTFDNKPASEKEHKYSLEFVSSEALSPRVADVTLRWLMVSPNSFFFPLLAVSGKPFFGMRLRADFSTTGTFTSVSASGLEFKIVTASLGTGCYVSTIA